MSQKNFDELLNDVEFHIVQRQTQMPNMKWQKRAKKLRERRWRNIENIESQKKGGAYASR